MTYKAIALITTFLCLTVATLAQQLYMPRNVQEAYTKGTRSMDGKPGPKYWQNKGRYAINLTLNPPSRVISGKETIVYTNNSMDTLNRPVIKLILNIHNPGTARMFTVQPGYLTTGITIDKFRENGKERPFPDPGGETFASFRLSKPLLPKDSVQLEFEWHYTISEISGREGLLDSTSFFLAYWYPRVAVFDDIHGWDRMNFTDGQEFYNDFNDYTVSVTVPQHFLVWGTGDLLNPEEVLQPAFLQKYRASFTSDTTIAIVTTADHQRRNVTAANPTNTWRFSAAHITDMAYCVSDHYVWDAASVVVDKKTGRRASAQSAYIDTAVNFRETVDHIRHSLSWFSNNWPGVPYPFSKSTVVQGTADMEYPMMANDSPQPDPNFQRFVAEHEIGHSYFPFYMGINEHRYGCMDEGWTTALEYLISVNDNGKAMADELFGQFRTASWAYSNSDEDQLPIITPANVMSGQGMGNNMYGKPALAYLGLKDLLGDALFRKCLHGFMDRWNGKHPIPWDMFYSFSNLSGKNLNWYWHNWFFTNSYMDIALRKLIPSPTGYTLSIDNVGGFVIPFNVIVEYADGKTDTIHKTAAVWEANTKKTTITINSKKKINHVRLDTDIFLDANVSDNTWGTSKLVPAVVRTPETTILQLSDADLDKYTGTYTSTLIPLKLIFTKEGGLVAEAVGQGKLSLIATGLHRFENKDVGITFEFNPDKQTMQLFQGGRSAPFTKSK
jgi:hypothetical protein